MLYQNEFPKELHPTANEVSQLKAAGFQDDSWHNDICPSFVKPCTLHGRPNGSVVKIWIDAISPADREITTDRFLVCRYNECEVEGTEFRTNYLSEAIDIALELANR